MSSSRFEEKSSSIPSKPQSGYGPFTPRIILHGGAGAISREKLPPDLYKRYEASLLRYLKSTHFLLCDLDKPTNALDAACHAVSLMEDDPLFNCGRGSVFNVDGHIEMEASVAIASVDSCFDGGVDERSAVPGSIKRSAAVSMIRNTRHPIRLAREVLLMADADQGLKSTGEMHGHLSGRKVEEWGWKEKRLERMPDEWFWTKRRWNEHRRGLGKEIESTTTDTSEPSDKSDSELEVIEISELPSQGTVGCVCLDSWGNVAVATSTGGLTNKLAGRIGDTPTVGAGFWAESWDETTAQQTAYANTATSLLQASMRSVLDGFNNVTQHSWIGRCIMPPEEPMTSESQKRLLICGTSSEHGESKKGKRKRRRAVAMSGTGNGDSFLRTAAARTTAAMCRFSGISLARATTAVAGPEGELQQSADDRWNRTGEGEGGIIGIEVIQSDSRLETDVVFDFNCGGMWRAWYHKGIPKVMVFRDEY